MAVGSAMCPGEWLSLALTHYLPVWGTPQGARRAYGQVGADNGPAQHLFAKLVVARLDHDHDRQYRLAAGPA